MKNEEWTAPEERYIFSKRIPDQILPLQRSVIFVVEELHDQFPYYVVVIHIYLAELACE
jgi:hypothetical protein